MPFVTTLTFRSGDRDLLDRVVDGIKEDAERKGVELKGPRAKPAEHPRVPQYKRLAPGDQFEPWRYTVYTRELEIVGYDDFARSVADREFPAGIHVGAAVDQVKQPGYRS